jgi:DNA-binding MurR/RpiR family transcriptional regulator
VSFDLVAEQQTGAPAGSVTARVRGAAAGLVPSEAKVVRALLEPGAEVIHLSVSDVAASAGVGIATVVRACQSLGFKGFQAAKIALARDVAPLREGPPEDVQAGDSPHEVLMKLAAGSGQALSRTPASVDPAALAEAVRLLKQSARVLILGVGTSAPLAADAAYRLATVGVSAFFPPDVHTQHVQARLLNASDLAVAISHTGATAETISAVRGARAAGAKVVAVTSFSNSPLTELADVCLVSGGLETRYRVEAMTSRLTHLLVLDTLFVALQLADAQRTAAAQSLTADVLAEHRF